MVKITIDKQGDLETNLHGICFARVRSLQDAIEQCEFNWESATDSVMVMHKDQLYVCDGVDPETGELFAPDVVEQLKATFDSYEVL